MKFEIPAHIKFQVQDSSLEYFFWEIARFEKRISLSEKKPHLIEICSLPLDLFNITFLALGPTQKTPRRLDKKKVDNYSFFCFQLKAMRIEDQFIFFSVV